MSKSLLADVARLMLKSHFEMSRIYHDPAVLRSVVRLTSLGGTGGHPFEFRVHAGPDVRILCSVNAQGQLTLAATQGDRTYTAQLPAEGKLEEVQATLTLSDGRVRRELNLSGKAFLDGVGVVSEFSDLHRLVVTHARRYLGLTSEGGTQAPATAAQASEAVSTSGAPTQDGSPAPEFQQYRIYRPQERDLVFQGKCLANVTGPVVKGRCWSYLLFKTAGGRYIGLKHGQTACLGESDRIETIVADTVEGTQALFGATLLAKTLYKQVGLDLVETIE